MDKKEDGALKWVGSWTKRTLAQAAKAQEHIGELLARPGTKYRELSDENVVLRRRTEEIMGNKMEIDGKTTTGALQVLKGSSGMVLGSKEDERLVKVSWWRKTLKAEEWKEIGQCSGGFYRAGADDIGCQIRAQIVYLDLFKRLASEIHREKNQKQTTSSPGPVSKQTEWPTIVVTKGEPIVISEVVRVAVEKNDPKKKMVQFFVQNKRDPIHRYVLELDGCHGDEIGAESSFVRLELRRVKTSSPTEKRDQPATEDDGTVSEGSEDDLEEGEDSGSKSVISAESFSISLPSSSIRIAGCPTSDTSLKIGLSTTNEDWRTYDLVATSNIERDTILVVVKQIRGELDESSDALLFAPLSVKKSSPSREDSASNTSIIESQLPCESVDDGKEELFMVECAYPQVWEALGYDFDLSLHNSSNLSKAETSSQSSSKFRMPSLSFSGGERSKSVLKSVSSLLSTALDPLGGEPLTGNHRKTSSGTTGENGQESCSFDLYKMAGFGTRYEVSIDLAEGEGLGITLGLFQLVETTDFKKGLNWPANGCSCVLVSGFCPTVLNGEECVGQLEKSGLIRPGDALVAINGTPVEPAEVTKQSDFSSYIPCSLSHVATVVKRARGELHDGSESGESNPRNANAACKMVFSFAQSNSGAAKVVASQNRLKETVQSLKQKLYESNARLSTVVTSCERRLEKNSGEMRRLCDFVDEQRTSAEHASVEKMLAVEQLEKYKESAFETRERLEKELEAVRHTLEAEKARTIKVESEKKLVEERIVRLEASMTDMAQEGEAWVNTIGTKEDALRKLDTDMRAQMIKYENLQGLYDGSIAERDRLRADLQEKENTIQQMSMEMEKLQTRVDKANDEADALISRMRLETEESDIAVQRAQHEVKVMREQVVELTDQLSAASSHVKALKEANSTAEERANSASKERQVAEGMLNEEKDRVSELQVELAGMQERLRSSKAMSSSTGASSVAESTELQSKLEEVEGANTVLRTQVKTLKSKVQSLSGEASRAAQLDEVLAEKNELLVQVQLEKAQRLEAEDELSAYKRALMQFAEVAKKNEREGNGEQWSNRPQIFDHLYKRQVSDEKASQQRR